MTASPAATFATRLVRAFAELGVEHAVVSPGSRSQALALALAELEKQGRITLHVRIDERVAAFTALGIARESGRPALVVTTSGTAAANLLPAVVEAHHSGVPMIVLTADRPAALRGTGSNQTTWQPGLFGRFVHAERDVPAPQPTPGGIPDARELAAFAFVTATSADSGPVHLNLQFVEPLSGTVEEPDARPASAASGSAGAATEPGASDAPEPGALGESGASAEQGVSGRSGGPARSVAAASLHLAQGPRTVVIAGADAGPAANELALAAGWPLLAEVSSGARFGPNLVAAYRELLDHAEFGGRVERAVVFGHPTLSRQIPALLRRDGVEIVVVRGPGEAVLPHPDAVVVDAVTTDPEDRSDRAARAWTGQWVFASRELLEGAADEVAAPLVDAGASGDLAGQRDFARAELAALRAPITRRSLALAVWRASWPHDRLVLGASRLIRELDAAAPGKKVPVHSNRGLAGIDGTISTAIGVALASQAAGRRGGATRVGATRVLLGDLALLHDVGALLLAPGEARPRIQLVVGNDGGGTIFDGLEVAATADPDAFDRVLYTPQSVSLASLASAYGWEHRLVAFRSDLESVLASPPAWPSIVEVALSR
ncbi:2-succinyl-5-enolpyruvyl-6-hydroxy-3-cyclohexene-1-carboxylic-acid synthase [Herbiconiux ginsengi]|uniref:2-succinyl-5-enolpyruvyl-6-hydroxy-3-cyclohexene-1-carboxylate synthase n=1 Tax=Herbiconiux ginsengi TaxID=381665 RepID=A0A1H3L3W9_9MICO|nr:2-succinyl-5-enolpyruvyl-6-hydroxy-3-cyclohexene-1-carboxylic-acid synthase [Herbiconiux ginsengi]SDY58946.1 2-succinyl-5-enolpyruvyl-6-hydroxy-3-cyclohexene-1-carboxylate synthase [Herbiconiux ginsengi]